MFFLFRLYTMRTLTAIIYKAFARAYHLCRYVLIFQETCLLILRHRLVFPDKIFSSQVQTLYGSFVHSGGPEREAVGLSRVPVVDCPLHHVSQPDHLAMTKRNTKEVLYMDD